MTASLTIHCDGVIDGRRCLSFAQVRSDPGMPVPTVEQMESVLVRGVWPFHADNRDGVNCTDTLPGAAWRLRVVGIDCPLHSRPDGI